MKDNYRRFFLFDVHQKPIWKSFSGMLCTFPEQFFLIEYKAV